ncbi:glycosyltransferase [Microbulbifer guangxiensis]|uniref:glycosyltransferase n=1 Tax=Microbulbifer guangxiensis TaxID=2904249 RepID=UPI001F487575|nr:glycosyltransferase [Microbulbifer guangxiensis]
MNVLLSAYACEPDKGSEPAVGWNWALEAAKHNCNVWVLTRSNNRLAIESYWSRNRKPSNLKFFYFDVPGWLAWWKKVPFGIYLYYLLWQFGAFLVARRVHRIVRFDHVQHITFASARQPSFMGLLGVPFSFGPVGGGESAPMMLRKSYPWRGWLSDLFRDSVNWWVRFSPLMNLTYSTATRIIVTSDQTLEMVPRRFRGKATISLAIGIEPQIGLNIPKDPPKLSGPRILYAGQLVYWKGVHLAIKTFAKIKHEIPDARLTILGRGKDGSWLKELSERLEVSNCLDFIDWVPRDEIEKVYRAHHVLLFPSLHDSGGMVVLEAMKCGLPVVSLDIGGPSVTVTEKSGFLVPVIQRSESEVVEALSSALKELFSDQAKYRRLSIGAIKRSSELSWQNAVASNLGGA